MRPGRREWYEQLVGPMPLVVSVGFMPPSILAVILGCLGLAEYLGRVRRLSIGPSGPLVPSGGALMLAPALGALEVALVVVGHSREPSSEGWGRLVGAELDAGVVPGRRRNRRSRKSGVRKSADGRIGPWPGS
jgi:hypothetical protein